MPFVIVWIGTACLLLVAGAVEYAGSRFMMAAMALTLISVMGTVVVTVLALRTFWKARPGHTIPVAIGLACSPFLVGGLLTLNGTEPNVHGAAIGGLFFFALLLEVTAAVLLVSSAIRALMSRARGVIPQCLKR